ncbi:hypothetical protein [Shewanella sp. 10N.286.48.A6]|uniref:hypothetical protein n=1 Tax=Shewanella sp. 10N.286.48.A6 TaxID=1880833 RepID=UPI000C846A8D|nr:hypothetical protein [Shewanella sp. 10N.286.48.A6]PMH97066.1 hypothetical protein BCU55_18960 [Shewanella sp. 10N.286.48.A6]
MIKTIIYYYAKFQGYFLHDKVDSSLGYPRFNEFVGYLENKQWRSFEEQYLHLSSDERHLLMMAIPEKVTDLDLYSEWRFSSTSYLALQFSGAIEMAKAWKVRGHTFAEHIPDDKLQAFHDGMVLADEYFNIALEQGAEDAELYFGIISAFSGRSPSARMVKDVFNQLLAIEGRHLPAAMYTLHALSERWYGSEDQMYRFAYGLAEKDPYYNSLILCAHIDKWSYDTISEIPMAAYLFLQDEIKAEIPEIEKDDLCVQGEDSYFSLQARNIYAFVGYKSKIRLLATKHLLKIRHQFTEYPWSEEGNPKDILNKARRASKMGPLKKK